MQAKRFTRRFPKHTGRLPVSSVLLNATRIALALAVASACRAQTVGTWTEFSAALPAGGEVIVTGDIAFENNLKVNEPASVTGEGGALLEGSLLTSRQPGVYATEPLSLSNLGTFTTDDVGFIEDPDALQGGLRNFAGSAVVIEQYAVNKKDVLVTVADQLCSSVLRPVFERPRPSHNPEIADIVHLVNGKRGGQFGFPSCHAANTFALACFVMLLFRNKTLSWFFMLWALVTCYTRAYIGVHYPGDLLFGTVVGFFAGILVYGIYRGCLCFHSLTNLLHYPQDRSRVEHQRPWHSTNLIFIAGVLTVIVFFLVSIWMRVN